MDTHRFETTYITVREKSGEVKLVIKIDIVTLSLYRPLSA